MAKFLKLPAFKSSFGLTTLEVLRRNENTPQQTTFVVTDSGDTFKAQAQLDLSKPMCVIVDKDDLSNVTLADCCLINYDDTKGAKSLAVL